MTDDLLLTCLVLVLLQEVGSTGKSDLCDIFLHFFCRHTKTVIDKGKGLVLRADDNLDLLPYSLPGVRILPSYPVSLT